MFPTSAPPHTFMLPVGGTSKAKGTTKHQLANCRLHLMERPVEPLALLLLTATGSEVVAEYFSFHTTTVELMLVVCVCTVVFRHRGPHSIYSGESHLMS